MKAIIVAAGMGRRLSPYTDDCPKCLVPVAGRPLLLRQIEAYRQAGVGQFFIVRGYMGEKLAEALQGEEGVTLIDNHDFRKNNILLSMMHASDHMRGGFLFSYSDIVFRPQLVEKVRDATGELALSIDPFWADAYEGRTDHPVSEAELAEVDSGRVLRVGKRVVEQERAHGEFIGLMGVSAAGAELVLATYARRLKELGLDGPYGTAQHFRIAYLSDLLNDLIGQGVTATSVDIERPCSWREIDTVQDLKRAHAVVDW